MVKKAGSKSRARSAKGHYKADDPSTPNVNEAFVSGAIGVTGVSASTKAPSAPKKKTMPPKDNVVPLVTLEGDRMNRDQAKKYWAKINKQAEVFFPKGNS